MLFQPVGLTDDTMLVLQRPGSFTFDFQFVPFYVLELGCEKASWVFAENEDRGNATLRVQPFHSHRPVPHSLLKIL